MRNFADGAFRDEHARMAHHRIAGIIVGDAEQAIGFPPRVATRSRPSSTRVASGLSQMT